MGCASADSAAQGGGWVQPEDISPAAVFLASDASAMVTGAEYNLGARVMQVHTHLVAQFILSSRCWLDWPSPCGISTGSLANCDSTESRRMVRVGAPLLDDEPNPWRDALIPMSPPELESLVPCQRNHRPHGPRRYLL